MICINKCNLPWREEYRLENNSRRVNKDILLERSEFLIATSPKKNCACVRLILVLVWGTYFVPDTYVPHFMIPGTLVPGTYYVPDTYDTRYVLCTRYVCATLAVVLLIVQLYRCLFVSGGWYAWYLRSAQETAVSLFVYSLVHERSARGRTRLTTVTSISCRSL